MHLYQFFLNSILNYILFWGLFNQNYLGFLESAHIENSRNSIHLPQTTIEKDAPQLLNDNVEQSSFKNENSKDDSTKNKKASLETLLGNQDNSHKEEENCELRGNEIKSKEESSNLLESKKYKKTEKRKHIEVEKESEPEEEKKTKNKELESTPNRYNKMDFIKNTGENSKEALNLQIVKPVIAKDSEKLQISGKEFKNVLNQMCKDYVIHGSIANKNIAELNEFLNELDRETYIKNSIYCPYEHWALDILQFLADNVKEFTPLEKCTTPISIIDSLELMYFYFSLITLVRSPPLYNEIKYLNKKVNRRLKLLKQCLKPSFLINESEMPSISLRQLKIDGISEKTKLTIEILKTIYFTFNETGACVECNEDSTVINELSVLFSMITYKLWNVPHLISLRTHEDTKVIYNLRSSLLQIHAETENLLSILSTKQNEMKKRIYDLSKEESTLIQLQFPAISQLLLYRMLVASLNKEEAKWLYDIGTKIIYAIQRFVSFSTLPSTGENSNINLGLNEKWKIVHSIFLYLEFRFMNLAVSKFKKYTEDILKTLDHLDNLVISFHSANIMIIDLERLHMKIFKIVKSFINMIKDCRAKGMVTLYKHIDEVNHIISQLELLGEVRKESTFFQKHKVSIAYNLSTINLLFNKILDLLTSVQT